MPLLTVLLVARNVAIRIEDLVERKDPQVVMQVTALLDTLHAQVNADVSRSEAIDLVAQHFVTAPVFASLLGDSDFRTSNPVALAMDGLLDVLNQHGLGADLAGLEKFYSDVRRRVVDIKTPAGRQDMLRELYEEFFKRAFPKISDRLGIVYTPIEIVDFLIASAGVALQKHFGRTLADKGVHVIDPFVGTGTFLTRLLQHPSHLDIESVRRKYGQTPEAVELHANEIVLLAYYVAAANIEQAFAARTGDVCPFPGLVFTDTFALETHQTSSASSMMPDNYARIKAQQDALIQVIVGNPPYAARQDREGDDNKNLTYPSLDARIAETYVAESKATNKNKLYDPYLRAFRWASDRIGDRGVIAFVSNASFLDGLALDGVRKSFAKDFSHLYLVNLRGNQRTSGELSIREGGKVFGGGSRVPIVLSILVKDPSHTGPAEIHYHEVADGLTTSQKLGQIRTWQSIDGISEWRRLQPNDRGDWLAQRESAFQSLMPIRPGTPGAVFSLSSNGLLTSRDWWTIGWSKEAVANNVERLLTVYDRDRERYHCKVESNIRVEDVITSDPREISWSHALKERLGKNKQVPFDRDRVVPNLYRPFTKRLAYFDVPLNERQYQLPRILPGGIRENRMILISHPGEFGGTCLQTSILPDFHALGDTAVFPRYVFDKPASSDLLSLGDGATRRDAVTDDALRLFREHYADTTIGPDEIFDYTYAVLNHPGYRDRWAETLRLEYPRLPFAPDFNEMVQIGRALGNLHCEYESAKPWPLHEDISDNAPNDAHHRYHIVRMSHPGGRGSEDRSRIVVNNFVTLTGIPEETHEYIVGARSALGWILDQYRIRTDGGLKGSGIMSDPNEMFRDDPHGIVDLIGRVVRVSVETVALRRQLGTLALPPLQAPT